MTCGGKHQLSFEAYHAVPDQWQPEAVVATHRELGGTFDVGGSPREAFKHGRSDYRNLWYNIADGVRAGDTACTELAVRFIEDNFIVSYSGYSRTRLAHALKCATLTPEQKERLSSHFLNMLERGDRQCGYTAYLELWPFVISEEH